MWRAYFYAAEDRRVQNSLSRLLRREADFYRWLANAERDRLVKPPWSPTYGPRCGYGSRYTTALGRSLRRRISRSPNQAYG